MFIKKPKQVIQKVLGIGSHIPVGVTAESNGHFHTISNPASDLTDPAPDGHVHQLSCSTCQRTRMAIGVHTWPTKFNRGHLHYFNSQTLTNLNK